VSRDLAVLCQAHEHVHVFFLLVRDGATSGGEHVDAERFLTLLLDVFSDIAESLFIIVDIFGLSDGFGKVVGGLHRMQSTGGLMRHHKAVSSVEGCGGYLCQLSPLRLVLVDHRLYQLRLDKDWLGSVVGSLDAPFLSKHQLFGGQLPLYLVTDKDASITVREDILVLLHTLEGIDLADNLDLLALFSKEVFHV
jgi:hypothetical protein